ncbi:MAG: adenosine kinase [Proteobacteria bacterium]|nr:adenosine kinase [Pseudomonadota bacterium]
MTPSHNNASTPIRYHVCAMGNALVDLEYQLSDAELTALEVDKGLMTLLDDDQRHALVQRLHGHSTRRTGGGSAANTVVALTQLGGQAHYTCRIADDENGHFYTQDLKRLGVQAQLQIANPAQEHTGTCLVLVTPDAERTMCTYLGATALLDNGAVNGQAIAQSAVYYMEGYLAASPTGCAAALQGRTLAVEAGVALALTLSDINMLRFCRENINAMWGERVDYLFCNENEAMEASGQTDFEAALATLAPRAHTLCITRGAAGSVVLQQGQRHDVPAPRITAVDSNGAGDMFAGAFLYAITHGASVVRAAELGNLTAAAVVTQHGNRLATDTLQNLQQRWLGSQAN